MFQFRPFPPYAYLIQRTVTRYCRVGFPHSEICGYNGYLLLPAAYRSLSRPSSAPDAKAFPLRSFQLDLFEIFGSHIVELCRQFHGSLKYEIVTLHLLRCCPQLKLFLTLLPSALSGFRNKFGFPNHRFGTSLMLPCLSLFSLFSFQGTTLWLFKTRLKYSIS